MQSSFVTFFAVALALAAAVLPALSTPILSLGRLPVGSRPRIGLTIPNIGNEPVALRIPTAAASRRDDLNFDSIMRKRIIDLHCTPAFAGTPLPADCYNRPAQKGPFFSFSKVAARALLAGMMN